MATKKLQVIGLKCGPGSDGVGISSIEQTTTSLENGGENIITITLTNGDQYTASIRNGTGGTGGTDESVVDAKIAEAKSDMLEEAKSYSDERIAEVSATEVIEF